MTSLVALCVAAAALISLVTSGLVGVGASLGRRRLLERAPEARARVLLALALSPVLVTGALMVAALAPALGWISDHCDVVPDLHAHPHICAHHEAIMPALPLMVIGTLLVLRVLAVALHTALLGASAWHARRTLLQRVQRTLPGGVRVLAVEEPQAFVLGVFRPVLFVTAGLLLPQHRRHVRSVLAHERAHLRRRDAWRALIARFAFAFHLPAVARTLEAELTRAHEMAADEAAARHVGSRAAIARSLVHLAKSQMRTPRAALAFGASDVEARVVALMERPRDERGPTVTALLTAVLSALLVVAFSAEWVHHSVESMLGALGG